MKIAVNASAPGGNFDKTGAHISNLKGIFDEYVTEWNPYIFGSTATIVSKIISEAKSVASGKFSHASKLKPGEKLYSHKKLVNLFSAILSQGADPWLAIHFDEEGLDKIHNAYLSALDNLSRDSKD